jgi:NADH dehydrogenase/NADH:ubiquinone oxidoreductase subunit G
LPNKEKPMFELTIDGQTIQIRSGATVMEAARENGIDIPHICYHPELSISGGCRLCMVEIEGWKAAVASCGLLCEEGMVVQTQSEQLTKIRRDVIDMFVAEHPLDCFVCDKAGACLLQKYAYEYGVSEAASN